MTQSNEEAGEQDKGKTILSVKERAVYQKALDECNRRVEEMHKDIYASRDYSDGVRFENERMKQWLLNMMGE